MKYLIALLFIISVVFCKQNHATNIVTSEAGVMVVKGQYFGKNIIINNPSKGDDFCVKEVSVNGKKSNDQLSSNAFEIDLLTYGFQYGDEIKIIIKHNAGCKPQLMNPQALEPEKNFSFTKAKWDRKKDLIYWTTRGQAGEEAFEIQQFRWEKWVTVALVGIKDSVLLDSYEKQVIPHNGRNLFRIMVVDKYGNTIYSKDVKCSSRNDEVFLKSSKAKKGKLLFTGQTQYQIYDQRGLFIKSGFGIDVDVSDMIKGKYWVNYDIKSEEFTVK